MSIVDSREERAQAKARLEELPTEALERDLVHWTLAAMESGEQFHEIGERLGALRDLHAEEEGWIRLHAEELRRRRANHREEVRS